MSTTLCTKCGGIVRLDYSSCPSCGAANTPSAPSGSRESTVRPSPRREDLDIEIRSRLMWGESPDLVRADILGRGVRAGELDSLLNRAVLARKSYYRKQGIKNLALGIVLLAAGLILLLATDDVVKGSPRNVSGRIILFGIAVPVGGILLIFKGARRLHRPGDGERISGDPESDD
jgi:hypothetical protein